MEPGCAAPGPWRISRGWAVLPFRPSVVLADETAPARKGARAAARAADPAAAVPQRALDFSLEEVREARLVPVLDFKGRRAAASGTEVDGGRER